ncbi:MAG: BMC domain-containing protein [Myxococcota bacterium]|nr:BMC domain-containing protein [Deltaproteobacteria bacterium]MDQ3338160.1 BMC domain-containing protein [Myxococcota bacterium]
MARGPALGVLEIGTIARGVVVADAALKRAPAVLLSSRAVSGGKHLVMLEGGVAEVEEAMAAGIRVAGEHLLDKVELPAADDQVWPMLGAPVAPPDWTDDPAAEAVVIIETSTVCAAIAAADAACKIAHVIVRDVRLAVDIAGKAYFTMTGTLDAIQAAAGAAQEAADRKLVGAEVIAQPSPDLRGRLFR